MHPGLDLRRDLAQKADAAQEQDIQGSHPLLSMSQSGVKKRPSAYNIPLPDDQFMD